MVFDRRVVLIPLCRVKAAFSDCCCVLLVAHAARHSAGTSQVPFPTRKRIPSTLFTEKAVELSSLACAAGFMRRVVVVGVFVSATCDSALYPRYTRSRIPGPTYKAAHTVTAASPTTIEPYFAFVCPGYTFQPSSHHTKPPNKLLLDTLSALPIPNFAPNPSCTETSQGHRPDSQDVFQSP